MLSRWRRPRGRGPGRRTAAPARAQAFADLKSALVDYSKADLEPRKACEALGQFKSKEIAQIARHAGPGRARRRRRTAASPACCRPEIAFEVSLPAKWNGRFYMIGNGGHAGESLDDAGRVGQRNQALQLGFAFAQTNTGHDARKEPGGSFVMSNPQKAVDYAYRAVHLTATTSKDITKDYYGRAASKAVLELVLQRRPAGADRGAALPRGLRRHRGQRAVGRSDRLHDWRDVESARAHGDAGDAGQDGDGGRQGDGEVRRDRRPEGRPDRRPAQVHVRPGARRARVRGRHRRRELPDAGAGVGGRQGLQRSGEQRQAVLPRLHARQRGGDAGPLRRRQRQRLVERDPAAGAAGRASRPTSTWPRTR